MVGLHVGVLWPNMRGGFQQVLMTQESQETLNILTLDPEDEARVAVLLYL